MPLDRPIVVVDTETATLSGAPHLLEIGALRVQDGEVIDQFESLVAPAVEIDPEATAIHGITETDVRSAPLAKDAVERFTAWAGDDWLCAHNAGFDARVFGFEHARTGASVPGSPFLCTLKLSRRHIPESPDHKLETLCQHLDFEDGKHHRALADAVWSWQVLEECAERADTNAATEFLAQCGTPVTIPGYVPGPARMKPRLRLLQEAVRNGEEVTLLYGGSDSGVPAPMDVMPRLLYERHKKSYLEAECLRTGLLKTYLLDRIQKVMATAV
ncbi:MAG: exonuclease domain-containing protein [Planctomycetota bacterium]